MALVPNESSSTFKYTILTKAGFENISNSFSEEEFSLDRLEFLALNVTSVPWGKFTYALTSAGDFEVLVLGQCLAEGPGEGLLIGSTKLLYRCIPIITETKYDANKAEMPRLSLAVAGEINETQTALVTGTTVCLYGSL